MLSTRNLPRALSPLNRHFFTFSIASTLSLAPRKVSKQHNITSRLFFSSPVNMSDTTDGKDEEIKRLKKTIAHLKAQIETLSTPKKDASTQTEYHGRSTISRDVIFRNQKHLRVRPMTPDDMKREQDFVKSLSSEAQFYRFFQAKRELSPEEAMRYTHVDYLHDFALAAVDPVSDEFAAVARYMSDPEKPEECEIAVVVGDQYYRLGIARYLCDYLIDIAASHHKTTVIAIILYTNIPAQRLFDRYKKKYNVTVKRVDSEVHYIIDISKHFVTNGVRTSGAPQANSTNSVGSQKTPENSRKIPEKSQKTQENSEKASGRDLHRVFSTDSDDGMMFIGC